MNTDDLMKAMNGLDKDLIEKADAYRGRVYKKGMRIPVMLASAAAVIMLILAGARAVSLRGGDAPGSDGGNVHTNDLTLTQISQEMEEPAPPSEEDTREESDTAGQSETQKAGATEEITKEKNPETEDTGGTETSAPNTTEPETTPMKDVAEPETDDQPETTDLPTATSVEETSVPTADEPESENGIRTVPKIESLIHGTFDFAEVKEVTASLEGFTLEELEEAWGWSKSGMFVDNPEWYLDVHHWYSGEYEIDVSVSREGSVIKALTYRTADHPTIW